MHSSSLSTFRLYQFLRKKSCPLPSIGARNPERSHNVKRAARGGRANSTSFLRFLYGWIDQSHDVTYGTMWRMTKLKVCCKNQNSGVLWATLCHNLQDENLLRHKLSAQVVIRTITLCNLQFGKINITRQVKCFFEWFASYLRNRKWRFPLLQVFHKETVIVLVSMT